MIRTLTTIDGDTADLVAFRTYGVTAGATEALLSANPGLAARGAVLGQGVVIVLPDLPAVVMGGPVVRLWD